MRKALLWQLGAALLAVVLSATFAGSRGAVSALLGGLVYVLPNSFFVWRLSLSKWRGGRDKVTTLVAGELLKLASVAGLLVLAAMLYRDVHWWAFLLGLVLALKANLFIFLAKI